MKFVVRAILSLLISSAAFAATPQTCDDLKLAYEADAISEFDFSCGADPVCNQLKVEQLRAAAYFILDEQRPDLSDSDLLNFLKPTYTKMNISGQIFDGVVSTLIDQPFVTYFSEGSTAPQKIIVDSETVKVDFEQCYDVQLLPFLSEVRKRKACELIVVDVNGQRPGTNLTVDDCTYENNDFVIAASSPTKAKLKVVGKIDNFTMYNCSVDIDRPTDTLSKLNCQVDN